MNLSDIWEDKPWEKGASGSQLQEGDRATECKIQVFRSLLRLETSLPERCSGSKSGQNPGWNSVVSRSLGSQKEWGCLSWQFPSIEAGKPTTVSELERELSAWFEINCTKAQSGNCSPCRISESSETALPWEDPSRCTPQESAVWHTQE